MKESVCNMYVSLFVGAAFVFFFSSVYVSVSEVGRKVCVCVCVCVYLCAI